MTGKGYQYLAMRTKSDNFSDSELMVNAALGLIGETNELIQCIATNGEMEIKKELGDICWYIALMCDSCGLGYEDIFWATFELPGLAPQESRMLNYMIFNCGEICDYIKKVYFQGHELDKAFVASRLIFVQQCILGICEMRSMAIEDVWERNINKLILRYPDGFRASDSINRED
jgi:hypothetical protein